MKTTQENLSTAFCAILFMLAGLVSPAQGQQDQTPARGFLPNGSYALTDLETINTANGNMMIHLPLASLPSSRGGLSARLFLIYNSKLWDSRLHVHPDPVPPHDDAYTKNIIEPSAEGGWRYGYRYQLQLFNRYDFESGVGENVCNDGYPSSENYVYHWKLKMSFPDGSVHEFRPLGFYESNLLNDGYFNVEPNGKVTTCNGDYYASTSGMTYYSTDGTYLRLFIEHDGDNYYGNNPWTLYMPNGTRVTGDNLHHRVYDRNDNYIDMGNVVINGQPAMGIVDQLGRGIAINGGANPGEEDIAVSGVGGTLIHTTVRWKQIWVSKQYRATYDPLPFGIDPNEFLYTSMRVIDRVTLPAQSGSLFYDFTYNASDTPPAPGTFTQGTGEMNSITLPTGAKATYAFFTQLPDWTNFVDNYPVEKTLTYRQEYDGVAVSNNPCAENDPNCITETWSYVFAGGSGTVTAPDGGETVEISLGGLSYKTIRSDGTTIERNWQNSINPFVKTEFVSIPNSAGSLVKTSIKDYNYDRNGNVTRLAEYDWVPYASVHNDGIPVWGLAGLTPARVTTTSYYNGTPDALDTTTPNDPDSYYNATAPRLLRLVASTEIASGTQTLARSEFFYDHTLTTGNLIEQKNWDSTKGANSNPLNASNSVSVLTQYNQHGSPILTTDAVGNRTQFVYGAVGGFTDLYPTEIRTAYQTAVQRTETRQYDFCTGVVTNVTDMDNGISTSTSYDVLGRPTLVKAAEGKPEEKRTATEYSDTARRVITRSSLVSLNDADPKLVSIQHYDQMGRVRLVRQLEDSLTQDPNDETQGIKVQTRYKYSGANSYQLSSRPYREGFSFQAPAVEMDWSRAKADNGGRLIEVKKFGGNTLPAPWSSNSSGSGEVITTYDANFTIVTDQAGKVRRSAIDGLGRLVRVDEPDANGSLGPNDNPNQPTSYGYDALGNLRLVTQGSQQRFFNYDSLSRLIRARNPEMAVNPNLEAITDPITSNSQWSVGYRYDNNGNLTQKTDARGVVTSYSYDALNRNTSVVYANDPTSTPAVTLTYDGATNGKGKLWKTETAGPNGSRTTINSFDALGRPTSQSQQFYSMASWSGVFSVSATYDKAGHLLTQTYPSGHSVSYSYDRAGRPSSFAGNLGDSTQRTYSSGMLYSPFGAMTKEEFGTQTPVFNKLFYNSQDQLAEIRESTSYTGPTDTSWDRGAIINHYSNQGGCWGASCNATDNNGNLRRQEVYIPRPTSGSDNFAQFYDYDSVNRLQSVRENRNGGALQWQQTYIYDRWGNRTIDQTNTWGAGINKKNFTVDIANNRLGVPAGQAGTMSYDAAGNLITDTYSASAVLRSYDAENRMRSETQANGIVAEYTYDGDGHRVRRKVDSTETWQVYGLAGELLAEYSPSCLWNRARTVCTIVAKFTNEYGYRNGQLLITTSLENSFQPRWLVSDQLGTPRMIFDQTGSLAGVSRHDYLPFGEEIFAGTGGRTTAQGYGVEDSVRQKFTQYERDNETGLDFAQARHYSSSQGRFTRPDPYNIFFEMKAGRDAGEQAQMLRWYASEPQNWNRYTYCLNDPVNLIDPSGLVWLTKDHENYQWVDDDKYKEEDWKGYEKAEAGTIAYFGEGWGGYQDKYKGLMGSYVTLNADGSLSAAGLTPDDAPPPENNEYANYTEGLGNFGVGMIVQGNRIHPTFQVGPSWPSFSFSRTTGNSLVTPGVYGQGTVGNYGLVVNESINLLHPSSGFTREAGYGSPQRSVVIQVVFPAVNGMTERDWLHHPDNVLGIGPEGRGGGRCPY